MILCGNKYGENLMELYSISFILLVISTLAAYYTVFSLMINFWKSTASENPESEYYIAGLHNLNT